MKAALILGTQLFRDHPALRDPGVDTFVMIEAQDVDAYEWVMMPNVIGMSQYADGGHTATKPYISGGNYLEKIGRWWGSASKARESEFTQLYWQFLIHQYDVLKSNHRMALVLKHVEARVKK
jgi:deoxyribodipyrimidine photolyase-related protein